MIESLYGNLRSLQVLANGNTSIETHEILSTPNTLVFLNDENAQKIRDFFNVALTNTLLNGFYENITILYVVDEKGTIRLAIEELYQDGEKINKRGVARLVGHVPHINLPKLGHPSLLDTKEKKCHLAGEISFFYGDWIINDHSGRYMREKPANLKHINNVVNVFGLFGSKLIPDSEYKVI